MKPLRIIASLDFISAVQHNIIFLYLFLLNTQQMFTLHLNTNNEDTYKKKKKTNTTYNYMTYKPKQDVIGS